MITINKKTQKILGQIMKISNINLIFRIQIFIQGVSINYNL